MKILLIILAFIVVLLYLPVGVDVDYAGGQLQIGVRVGPKVFWLYPSRFGKKDHKQRKKAEPEEHIPEMPKVKKPRRINIDWDEIRAALDLLIRCVKKLRFRVRRLKLYFTSAFPDPYDTAMAYGCAAAAVNLLGLERVKGSDVRLDIDFTSETVYVEAYFALQIRIYYLMKFGLLMAFGCLRLLFHHWKRLKQEEKSNALIAGKEG